MSDGSLHDLWVRAGVDGIAESDALDLFAMGVPEVTMSLAMNPSTPPTVLQRIHDAGGDAAAAARVNRNSPAAVKGLAPIGAHTDESVWLYAKAMGASDQQLRALIERLDGTTRPGGVLLQDAWDDVVRRYPGR